MPDEEKKSFSERFANYFMSIDLKAIVKEEFENTLFPHFVDTLVDSLKMAFSNTVDELAYHGKEGRERARSRKASGHMPYNSIYNGPRKAQMRAAPLLGRANYVVEDIEFRSREKAQEVLEYLQNILDDDRYDFVTVLNLYDAAGMPTNASQDKFGWFDLSEARIFKDGNKWILRMPRPQSL